MTTLHLPPQSSSFVGRQTEIAEVIDLLSRSECRLLTVSGVGGIGKTRLAIEVAARLSEQFADGIFFVPLHSISSAANIGPMIAQAVDFQFRQTGDLDQQLLDFLREKQLLLLLDNFEHVVDGIDLLTVVMAAAPDVKILVTSREVLRLQQEWVFDLRGMVVPEDGERRTAETCSAVQLFVERAQRVKRQFDLEQNAAHVVRVCQLVEGMPLALELAAAWTRVLPCARLAEELQDSLDLLTSRDRVPVIDRHASMRAVLERSWGLLDDAMQTLLMKLAVFRGGFSFEAAQAVAGADLDMLAALVDKSMVRVEEADHYELHELLRMYASEKLELHPQDRQAAKDRHCEYYARLLESQESRIASGYHREVATDMENLRLAWQWAIAERKLEEVQLMASPLFLIYWWSSWQQEGAEVFNRAVEALKMDSPAGRQGVVLGLLVNIQGALSLGHNRWNRQNEGWVLMRRGLAILRQLDAPGRVLAGALRRMVGHGATKDGEEARQFTEESIKIAREQGDLWFVAICFTSLGNHYYSRGEFTEAKRYFQEAYSVSLVADNPLERVVALRGLGGVASRTGDYDAARQYFEEAVALHHEMDNDYFADDILWELGLLAYQQGDYARARRLYDEGLAIVKKSGQSVALSVFYSGLSALAWREENYSEARRLGNESLLLRRQIGMRNPEGYVGALVAQSFFVAEFGGLEEAAGYCCEALRAAQAAAIGFAKREAFIGFASLLSKAGQIERAVELLGLAHATPWDTWGGRERWPIYAGFRDSLRSEAEVVMFANAWKRGQSLDLKAATSRLLSEFAAADKTNGQAEAISANEALVEPLTRRELDVLHLLADGYSNKEIADELTVVVGTVKTHVYNICQKLGARSRTHAIAKSRALRLL